MNKHQFLDKINHTCPICNSQNIIRSSKSENHCGNITNTMPHFSFRLSSILDKDREFTIYSFGYSLNESYYKFYKNGPCLVSVNYNTIYLYNINIENFILPYDKLKEKLLKLDLLL